MPSFRFSIDMGGMDPGTVLYLISYAILKNRLGTKATTMIPFRQTEGTEVQMCGHYAKNMFNLHAIRKIVLIRLYNS